MEKRKSERLTNAVFAILIVLAVIVIISSMYNEKNANGEVLKAKDEARVIFVQYADSGLCFALAVPYSAENLTRHRVDMAEVSCDKVLKEKLIILEEREGE